MKLNRAKLAEAIAIDRAEYELEYASRPDAWQPLAPFVHAAAIRIAKGGTPVAGIQADRVDYGTGWYVQCRIDWAALAARVARQVPRWKETIVRVNQEGTPS